MPPASRPDGAPSHLDRIARVIAERFALTVARVEPAPRGWTGETYFVTTAERGRLFAKHYRADRLPAATLPALPVLAALHRQGVRGLTVPVPSAAGVLHEPVEDGVLVLFECVDGVQTEAFDTAHLGALVAEIHGHGAAIAAPVPRESFRVTYADALWDTLGRARSPGGGDELARGLRAFLDGLGRDVERDWAAFEAIAGRCRDTAFPLVLTHGDLSWNVMVDRAGALHLVDWDELLLAPAERDLWFFQDRPEFMRTYGERRSHPFDDLAAAYYVHHRYFEELLAFAKDVLDEDAGARRAEALTLLRGPWITGLRARIASTRVG